jgi:hypothetical protein
VTDDRRPVLPEVLDRFVVPQRPAGTLERAAGEAALGEIHPEVAQDAVAAGEDREDVDERDGPLPSDRSPGRELQFPPLDGQGALRDLDAVLDFVERTSACDAGDREYRSRSSADERSRPPEVRGASASSSTAEQGRPADEEHGGSNDGVIMLGGSPHRKTYHACLGPAGAGPVGTTSLRAVVPGAWTEGRDAGARNQKRGSPGYLEQLLR